MTPERLREIAKAATPGPWSVDPSNTVRLQTPVAPPFGFFWSDSKHDQNARLIALAPDLARVAADLAEALVMIRVIAKNERFTNIQGFADKALAAFEQLGEQDDTQAATEHDGEEVGR